MQQLNTLNKTYLPGEILFSDNLNLIVDYINQLINAINELMANDGTSIGHYEIRYKDSLSEPSPPSTGSSGLSDGWKRSVDSVVYNIWMTLCFVTAGDVYGTWTKPIKISAKDGINGSFMLEVYRNDSAEAVDLNYIPEVVNNDYSNPTFPPTGWTTTILPRPEGKYTWCILRTISFNENNNLVYGKWSIPFRLTGDNGKPGEDGDFVEFIYTRNNTGVAPAAPPTSGTYPRDWPNNGTTDHQTDDNGVTWYDNPQGVISDMKWEYVSSRKYDGSTQTWSDYSTPGIWSKFGENGRDGDGYEYIFKGGQTYGDHPSTINTSDDGKTKDLDDFVPSGWSDDPVTLTEDLLYVWVSTRKRKGGGSWGNFTDPKIWAHWSLKGSNGGHYEFRYKNSATQPNAPTGEGTSDGWSSIPSAPDFANGVYTWMSQCFVSGEGNYDTWTTPVRITGANGEDGADGTDIEFIYARKTEIWLNPTAPTVLDDSTIAQNDWPNVDGNTPSSLPINGTIWYDNPQGVTSTEKYEYMCVRYKHAGASSWTAYSPPVIWSAFGNKGADGDGVEYIFYADKDGRLNSDPVNYPPGWNESTTGKWKDPQDQSQGRLVFQDNEFIANGSSWEDEPIDLSTASGYGPGTVQWVSMRKKQNGVWQAYSEPAVWSRLGKDGVVDGYTVDLSNENMPVGTSSDGTVSGWSNSSLIQVFHNTTPLTYDSNAGTNPTTGYFNYSIGTITRSDDPTHQAATGFSASKSNDTVIVSISTITNFNEVSATVPITIYLPGGIERELVITVFGVATGEAGQFIDMVLSSKVIRSNNTGTEVSPTTVSMGIMIGETTYWSTQGSPEGSAESKGYSFKYRYDETGSFISQTGPITVGTGHSTLTVNMYKDNYLIDSENIPFIKDGENALVIDIDNDNDQFGTDSESKVLIQQTRSTKVTMFYGTTKQRFTSVPTAVLKYDDGETTVPSGVAKVEVSPNTANSNEYTVTLTIYATGSGSIPLASRNGFNILITGICEQGTKTITFTVEKVMSGARGVTPIIYQLAPSLKSLTFSRNANSLTPQLYDVEVNVLKIEGNTTTEVKSSIPGITYSWGWDKINSHAMFSDLLIGSTITVTNSNASSHNQVWIKLSTGDTETLPIVKDGANGTDGEDGADGDDAVSYDIVFEEAWAKVDDEGKINGNLAGFVYRIEGSNRTAMNGLTVRYGYILNDSTTYTEVVSSDKSVGVPGYFNMDGWINDDDMETFAKGSLSIFAAIIVNGTPVCVKYVTISKDGSDGERGKVGRFFYFGGVWEDIASGDSFVLNDAQAPYFEHTEGGLKKYHVYNPNTSPSGGSITKNTMSQTNFDSKPWEVMTNDFKYLITEALFADFAKLGSGVFNKDWLFSAYGNAVSALYSGSGSSSQYNYSDVLTSQTSLPVNMGDDYEYYITWYASSANSPLYAKIFYSTDNGSSWTSGQTFIETSKTSSATDTLKFKAEYTGLTRLYFYGSGTITNITASSSLTSDYQKFTPAFVNRQEQVLLNNGLNVAFTNFTNIVNTQLDVYSGVSYKLYVEAQTGSSALYFRIYDINNSSAVGGTLSINPSSTSGTITVTASLTSKVVVQAYILTGSRDINYVSITPTNNFVPKIAIDWLSGYAHFGGDSIRFNPNGSGHLANGNISWDVGGNATFTGQITATGGTISGNMVVGTSNQYYMELNPDANGASFNGYDNNGNKILSLGFGNDTGSFMELYKTNGYLRMKESLLTPGYLSIGGNATAAADIPTTSEKTYIVMRAFESIGDNPLFQMSRQQKNTVIAKRFSIYLKTFSLLSTPDFKIRINASNYNTNQNTIISHNWPLETDNLEIGDVFVDGNGHLRVKTS